MCAASARLSCGGPARETEAEVHHVVGRTGAAPGQARLAVLPVPAAARLLQHCSADECFCVCYNITGRFQGLTHGQVTLCYTADRCTQEVLHCSHVHVALRSIPRLRGVCTGTAGTHVRTAHRRGCRPAAVGNADSACPRRRPSGQPRPAASRQAGLQALGQEARWVARRRGGQRGLQRGQALPEGRHGRRQRWPAGPERRAQAAARLPPAAAARVGRVPAMPVMYIFCEAPSMEGAMLAAVLVERRARCQRPPLRPCAAPGGAPPRG
jgi:hypothetical protein